MGNLLVSLRNAAGAMRVFERGVALVQNNVANINTPGYARQQQVIVTLSSDLDRGLAGGIRSGGTLGSRNVFAEQSVRRNLFELGYSNERMTELSRMEPVLDIHEGAGVAGAIDALFQSFSALAVTPNDGAAREVALQRATELAGAFHQLSNGLVTAEADADRSIVNQVAKINEIAGRLWEINQQFKNDFRAQQDAGLDAQLNTLLEELSDVVDFTTLRAEDGSVSVFLGGEVQLLTGSHLYTVTADVSGATAKLLDSEANDVTARVHLGRLGAAFDVRNTTLPGYLDDLDRLAQVIADNVNATLNGGVDLTGQPPATPLFTYDALQGAARTLAVNPLAPGELALADPAAPGGNGNALRLAALVRDKNIDGGTYTQFFGSLVARAGGDLAAARGNSAVNASLAAQAKQMRDEITRVNLDEEAITLMEFQRAYQATAKLVQTLDEMTKTVMDLL